MKRRQSIVLIMIFSVTLSAFNFGPSLIRWMKKHYNMQMCATKSLLIIIFWKLLIFNMGCIKGTQFVPFFLCYVQNLLPTKFGRMNKFHALIYWGNFCYLSYHNIQMIVWMFCPVACQWNKCYMVLVVY